MVEMDADRNLGRLGESGLDELHDVNLTGVFTGTGGNLKNNRGFFIRGSLHDALDDFHVVHVEGADGVVAVIGGLEHFFGSNKRHVEPPVCSSPCMGGVTANV